MSQSSDPEVHNHIPCFKLSAGIGFYQLIFTLLFVPLSVSLSLFKTMDFAINITKCVLFYLIGSAHILTSDEFFTLLLFPSSSLPKEPISSQALLLTIIESEQERGRERVHDWREREREKWVKTLLNWQSSRNSYPNRQQCVFNNSHSV